MAITVGLVIAVTGAPSYTGRLFRGLMSPMWFGKTAAKPLGARSGVAYGTKVTCISVSGTTITIAPHAGVLDLQAALEASVYTYVNDANATLTHAAAHATQARKDLVCVRLDDPDASDGSSVPAAVFTITKGAEDGSNVVPATPARSMPLATVNVPASGGGASTITWTAPYAVASGGIIPVRTIAERAALATAYPPSTEAPLVVWNAATGQLETTVDGTTWNGLDRRPANAAALAAITGMRAGDFAYQVDTTVTHRYSGTAWKAWASPWIAYTATPANFTASAQTCRYRYVGGEIEVDWLFTVATMGTGPNASLPKIAVIKFSNMVYCGNGSVFIAAGGNYGCNFHATAGSTTQVTICPAFSGAVITAFSATSPAVWAAGDRIQGRFMMTEA